MLIYYPHEEHGKHEPQIAEGCQMKDCKIDATGQITIGKNTWINEYVQIYTHRHSAMAPEVQVNTLDIGERVTIGAYAIITPLCTKIGSRSTVALGSVVMMDVPEDVLVAGNPAQIIKRYEKGEQKAHVLDLQAHAQAFNEAWAQEMNPFKKLSLEELKKVSE